MICFVCPIALFFTLVFFLCVLVLFFCSYNLLLLLPPSRRLCFRRCLFVRLSVCLLATLRKNFQTDLNEIFSEGWQWASKQITKFWWWSGCTVPLFPEFVTTGRYGKWLTDINLLLHPVIRSYWFADGGTDITTLLRSALAEVCTVPVLPVYYSVFKIIHVRLLCANKYFLLTCLLTYNSTQ